MAERRFYQGETFANYDPGELLENAEFEDCVFDHCRWLGTRGAELPLAGHAGAELPLQRLYL